MSNLLNGPGRFGLAARCGDSNLVFPAVTNNMPGPSQSIDQGSGLPCLLGHLARPNGLGVAGCETVGLKQPHRVTEAARQPIPAARSSCAASMGQALKKQRSVASL